MVQRNVNAHDISIESLLLMIAFAKEEANRLGLEDVVKMLELPELSVLQTYTGFDDQNIGNVTTMADALSNILEKNN